MSLPIGSKIEEWQATSDAKRKEIEEINYISFSTRIMSEVVCALENEVTYTGNKRVVVNALWKHQFTPDKFILLFDRWVKENSELYNGLKCSYEENKYDVYCMYISF